MQPSAHTVLFVSTNYNCFAETVLFV